MPDESDSERLRRLEARIAAAKGRTEPRPHQEEHYSQANIAWRMVTELVAGLGIGLAIGLGLDTLFGTTPILMVIFLGFGLAAGINVMLRTAREVQARAPQAHEAGGDKTGQGGDAPRDRTEGQPVGAPDRTDER
ncbi:F0F1 ATP synthase subunit I [Rhodovulum sp. 12E13]|uniref:AtpZ/AtpI family protein n=1 Tax=Rhodovulum sp. 12E13 TaxID=2203891 RepID=UPI000E1B3E2F|nr:AtpZ/AtpI family protein [Rhodovulum sp. 12E13]RDC74822.1 F0F1 ATP synthase subunit I [Rhodovulum sp. 12E13]